MQATDANGKVTFTSIFPAAYSGRWPHIHFEVYPSVAEATTAGTNWPRRRSRCPRTSATRSTRPSGYEQSVTNLAQTSLETDMVFSDGWDAELGTVTGTVADGLKVALTVPV